MSGLVIIRSTSQSELKLCTLQSAAKIQYGKTTNQSLQCTSAIPLQQYTVRNPLLQRILEIFLQFFKHFFFFFFTNFHKICSEIYEIIRKFHQFLWLVVYNDSSGSFRNFFYSFSSFLAEFFLISTKFSSYLFKIYEVWLNIFQNLPKAWKGHFGKGFLIYYWKPVFSVILIVRQNLNFELALSDRDGMLRARVDYKKLVSKKSSFVNCCEEKLSAHCSASALLLVRCMFANLLIDERVKEQEYYVSSTLLSVFLGERKQTLLEPFLVYV